MMYGSFVHAAEVSAGREGASLRRRKRATYCASSMALFFAAGYVATSSGLLKEAETSALEGAWNDLTASFQTNPSIVPYTNPTPAPYAFLQDDIASLPEDVIKSMENMKSTDDAVTTVAMGGSIDVTGTASVSCSNAEYPGGVETGYALRYPWKYVAEPSKPTTLSIDWSAVDLSGGGGGGSSSSRRRLDGSDPDFFAKWLVDGHVQGYGSSVGVLFTELGEHEVIVAAKDNNQNIVVYVAFKVMVKYVRREIRSLTDVDREAYFNAVQIMTRVPTEIGQTMYGTNYKSKDYFNRLHLYYGGTNDCDHWHGGRGFVTSHVTLTLEFERVVQSVFPSISQPYWDFTLESTFYDATEFRSSDVFTDSWFGDANPDNDLHTPTTGRNAFTPAMTDANDFSQVVNSYGMLRSPWNADPTPFMTRAMDSYGLENNLKPSGCSEYYVALQKNNWMDFAKQLTTAAHGHIHETIGGAWGNDLINERYDTETATLAVYNFNHMIQALSKISWRSGVTKCPSKCSMDTAAADCECSLDEETYGDMAAPDILDKAGVLQYAAYYDMDGEEISDFYLDKNKTKINYVSLNGMTKEETAQSYKEMLKIVSKPAHIGDMFQATSSNDIMFWVLHGAVDRLWHFKMLGSLTDYDTTWTNDNACYCNNPTDYQPFKNIFDADDRYYSNEELRKSLNANNDGLSYMYENFKWDHCDKLGYTMANKYGTDI